MFRLILSLALLVVALASTCENLSSSSSCLKTSGCSWCSSGAVGESCMDSSDAAGLPASVFTCEDASKSLTHHHSSGSGKSSGGGNSGDPTMYVFAYSWTPGFCNTESNDPGCSNPESYWKNHFTIHGLWPQYTTEGYPANCSNEPFTSKSPEAVGMDSMNQYWPNVQAKTTDSDYDDFWQHEWSKHGTCSGLSQTDYFNTTINLGASFGTPSIFTNNVGKSVNADDLRTALGGKTKASLICSKGNQLTGAYTCWNQVNGVPTSQATCPQCVQQEDTCTSGSVDVVAM
jgi:ribonuclease T2